MRADDDENYNEKRGNKHLHNYYKNTVLNLLVHPKRAYTHYVANYNYGLELITVKTEGRKAPATPPQS